MKTLSRYVVKVTNQRQLDIALKFFLRASRRPMHPQNHWATAPTMAGYSHQYVGMLGRFVNFGPIKFDHEQVLAFKDMARLADTPTRIEALKESGFFPVATPVIPKVKRPLVRFHYPSREGSTYYPLKTVRNVRLIKADAKYYVGLEVLPDNKFQFKKFLKSKAQNVEVVEL